MFDELKSKAAKLAKDHPDQVEKISDQVIEKAGDAADKMTGGKHADHVNAAQQKADDAIGEPGERAERAERRPPV